MMKELEKIVDSNGEPLEIVDAEAREDISEIKQSLSDLDKRVDASSANQSIDITAYSDSNMYTFPSDGYICLNGGSSNSGYIRACLQMGNQRVFHYMNVTVSYTIFTIYVKKGIKYFTAGNTVSGGTVKFTPLINQS